MASRGSVPSPRLLQPDPHHRPRGQPSTDEHSQVVLVNQDKKSIQGQETNGSPCGHTCGCEAPAHRTPPAGAGVHQSWRPPAHRPGFPSPAREGGQSPELPEPRPQQTRGSWALTHVVGAGKEVDHEAGLGQVRQDGVVHDYQHLLVETEGQLAGKQKVWVHLPYSKNPVSQGAPPTPTLCLRKPSHIPWKAFLCSYSGGGGEVRPAYKDTRHHPSPLPSEGTLPILPPPLPCGRRNSQPQIQEFPMTQEMTRLDPPPYGSNKRPICHCPQRVWKPGTGAPPPSWPRSCEGTPQLPRPGEGQLVLFLSHTRCLCLERASVPGRPPTPLAHLTFR